jgi:hypothetical protein
MCEAAELARKAWFAQQERCWRYFFSLMNGLIEYSVIPPERITYLCWNGLVGEERNYTGPENGGQFTLPGAVKFDEDDGFWHLGVHIALRPPNHFPPTAVSFVLCVKDQDGQPLLKIGLDGKTSLLNMSDPIQVNSFYDRIIEDVNRCFREPNKSKQKSIGFFVEPE